MENPGKTVSEQTSATSGTAQENPQSSQAEGFTTRLLAVEYTVAPMAELYVRVKHCSDRLITQTLAVRLINNICNRIMSLLRTLTKNCASALVSNLEYAEDKIRKEAAQGLMAQPVTFEPSPATVQPTTDQPAATSTPKSTPELSPSPPVGAQSSAQAVCMQSVERVIKLPVVEQTTFLLANLYGRVKYSNRMIRWTFTVLEKTVGATVKIAKPICKPIRSRLETPIEAVDSILVCSLNYIENKVPAVKLTPQEIYNNTKQCLRNLAERPLPVIVEEPTPEALAPARITATVEESTHEVPAITETTVPPPVTATVEEPTPLSPTPLPVAFPVELATLVTAAPATIVPAAVESPLETPDPAARSAPTSSLIAAITEEATPEVPAPEPLHILIEEPTPEVAPLVPVPSPTQLPGPAEEPTAVSTAPTAVQTPSDEPKEPAVAILGPAPAGEPTKSVGGQSPVGSSKLSQYFAKMFQR